VTGLTERLFECRWFNKSNRFANSLGYKKPGTSAWRWAHKVNMKKTVLIGIVEILLIVVLFGSVGGETITMQYSELSETIKKHLSSAYPEILVEAKPWHEDKSKIAVYFTEKKFDKLYPMQRYHYLVHNIPDDFFEKYLSNAVWFELAPGEKPDELRYPDEELIHDIKPHVMKALKKSNFFISLDDLMAPNDVSKEGLPCHGDFDLTKQVLKEKGFKEKGFKEKGKIDEIFDICHVLMSEGAYCDCEVLYNVSDENRLKARYWKQRSKDMGSAQQRH